MISQEIVQKVLASAVSRGGEFAEIFVEDKKSSSAAFDDGKVEELTSGVSIGAGIRVIVGETTGFAHTADLSEAGLLSAAEAARSVAMVSGSGTKAVALSAPNEHTLSGDILVPSQVGKKSKIELLEYMNQIARSTSGSIKQVSAGYGDSYRRILVANTDGVFATDEQVRTRIAVSVVAFGDTGMQTGYETAAFTMGFEMFEDVNIEELATLAAERAVRKLSARPAPSGTLPVVLQGGSGGILFHEACGHGLEADHIIKDSSVYKGKVGELVASPLITLVDDGTVSKQWGTALIDDEGRPSQRNVLIENGVLTDYMWDGLRAKKLNRVSTGNGRRQSYQHLPMVRMTNTYLVEGKERPDTIIENTKHGVYVARLGGGQVNTATGDFVFGMTEAYLIENGEITEPLRDANLIGNGPEVLKNIDAVANDFSITPGTCGKDGQSVPVGCGQATVRITGVTIGGTANG
ncbi:MAG: TldD/PmbA family protein [Candidatus Marsarchaeota archaeon]|nr:TldD/PmbA family protein [Candidatus Marsarchaeota archaeon]